MKNFFASIQHATKLQLCPICQKPDWCYRLSDQLVVCKRSDSAPYESPWHKTTKQDSDGGWYFGLDNGQQSEWAARKEIWENQKLARAANQREASQKEMATWLTADQRDPLIRRLSNELGLTYEHRQILRNRGLTEPQIAQSLFFSIGQYQPVPDWVPFNLPGVYLSPKGDRQLNGKGIAIVTRDPQGLATGWQIMNDDPRPQDPETKFTKYFWAKGQVSSKLPIGNGELPIQVPVALDNTKEVWAIEGTLKPYLTAHRHDLPVIGASSGLFRSAPEQVAAALAGINQVTIAIDAGDITNPARVKHWRLEVDFFQNLGMEVRIAWWDQKTKADDDIDELPPEKIWDIEYLEPETWFQMADLAARKAADITLFHKLSSLTITPTEQRQEPDLAPLPMPRPGHFLFVNSPCGTGKTRELKPLIDNWLRVHPAGRSIMIGYRNALLDNAGERLNFPSYRTDCGWDNVAIDSYDRLRICLDSLLRLKLDSIPPNTLVIFDEVEAILAHATLGGTLGNNAPAVQVHLVAIIQKVLSTGGAVIGLEDNLTDLSLNGLQDLTQRQFPIELITNSYERFNWNVSIGNATIGVKIGLILDRLATGETVIVPTTSQNFGETLERIVLNRLPELAGKVVRLDSKTAPELPELMKDPDGWLTAHHIRLLIVSPTAESGFSIQKYHFDRDMGNIANLNTRAHIQILSRDRSDAPRDIFVGAKGAEAGKNRGQDPVKLVKMRASIANQTSLQLGNGKIAQTPEGAIWNRLDAEFSARDALSAKYQSEFLESELLRRGHQVQQVDWQEVRSGILPPSQQIPNEELKFQYKEVKQQIQIEENNILWRADGRAISPEDARRILHSSGTTFEQRQQAIKSLLHQDLPGVDLSEEFLMKAITQDRGAYRRACELTFLLDKPQLATHLDREIFMAQSKQPHILYRRVPKHRQQVDLLAPIANLLMDLANGREYQENDLTVMALYKFALEHSYLFWVLFGITIKETQVDSIGRRKNTMIAMVNKILKKAGYETQSVKRVGCREDRVRIYQVINSDCEHRQTIYEALSLKYAEQLQEAKKDVVSMDLNSKDEYLKTVDTKLKSLLSIISLEDPPDPPLPEEVAGVASSLDALFDGEKSEVIAGILELASSINC